MHMLLVPCQFQISTFMSHMDQNVAVVLSLILLLAGVSGVGVEMGGGGGGGFLGPRHFQPTLH